MDEILSSPTKVVPRRSVSRDSQSPSKSPRLPALRGVPAGLPQLPQKPKLGRNGRRLPLKPQTNGVLLHDKLPQLLQVELYVEEDVSTVTKTAVKVTTTKRGRRVKLRKYVSDDDDADSEFDSSHSEGDNDDKDNDIDDIDDDDDPAVDDLDVDDLAVETTKPRTTRSKLPLKSPSRAKLTSTTPKPAGARGSRGAGRPSKAHGVVVESIFTDLNSPKQFLLLPSKELFLEKLRQLLTNTDTRLSLLTTYETQFRKATSEFGRRDIILGIKRPSQQQIDAEAEERRKQYRPLPVPELDRTTGKIDELWFDENFTLEPALPELKVGITSITHDAPKGIQDYRAVYLEGAEGYFEQNSIRGINLNHGVGLAPQLDYDDYMRYTEIGDAVTASARAQLREVHRLLFPQWCFELSQGFSLNFYGVGSKLDILNQFILDYIADWLANMYPDDDVNTKYLVINGFNPKVKLKDVITSITDVFRDHYPQETALKFPKYVTETVPFLIRLIERYRTQPVQRPSIVILIHNIDGEGLRDDKDQRLLSELAALPEVYLLLSTHTVNAALLWDSARAKNFNWVWHDLTTYDPYTVESSFKDVLALGHSKNHGGGTGSKFVLKSLLPNARNLYKVTLEMQLEVVLNHNVKGKSGLKGSLRLLMLFDDVYQRCLAAMVVLSTMQFRNLLKEFIDHKMLKLVVDKLGDERLYVPFSVLEMERLLHDEFK